MPSILRTPLWLQVLIALALAVIVGFTLQYTAGPEAALIGDFGWKDLFGLIGTLFLQALKMLIIPLVGSAIIVAIGGMERDNSFGRLFSKTIAYYLCTSAIAVLIGLFWVNLIQPGNLSTETAQALLGGEKAQAEAVKLQEKVGDRGTEQFLQIIERIIPVNIIASSSTNGQLLSVIFFALLFGYFMNHYADAPGVSTVKSFWQGVYEIMIKMTEAVMIFTPIGVFGLVANICMDLSITELLELGWYFATVVLSLGTHFFIALPLILFFIAGVNPLRHYIAMRNAILTSFSTASSSATLPVTIDCVRDNAKVSPKVTNFVLPLGATVNMDGTALYECVVVVFLAQLFAAVDPSFSLTLADQLLIVALAIGTSIGVAGVPQASLVAIVAIMSAVGIPTEYIGVAFILDRILDMMRTSVNVFSDSCGAVLVARTEGETDVLADDPFAPEAAEKTGS